jgi:hypothetical protein
VQPVGFAVNVAEVLNFKFAVFVRIVCLPRFHLIQFVHQHFLFILDNLFLFVILGDMMVQFLLIPQIVRITLQLLLAAGFGDVIRPLFV